MKKLLKSKPSGGSTTHWSACLGSSCVKLNEATSVFLIDMTRHVFICLSVGVKIMDRWASDYTSKPWWADCIIVTLGDFPPLPWLNAAQPATSLQAGTVEGRKSQFDGLPSPALKAFYWTVAEKELSTSAARRFRGGFDIMTGNTKLYNPVFSGLVGSSTIPQLVFG